MTVMPRASFIYGGLLVLLIAGCGDSGDVQADNTATNVPSMPSVSTSSSTSDTIRTASTSTAPPPTTAVCTAHDLEASLGGSEGAAGTTYRALVFTNASAHACTIVGRPRVLFVAGEDQHQVGAAATFAGADGPVVTVEPGAAATAPVGFVNVGNFDPRTCQPTDVRGLRVTPPNGKVYEFVPFDTTACGAADFRNMTVRAVHSGAGLG